MTEYSDTKINLKTYILHLASDDPKKCTALKMARFNYAVVLKKFYQIPYGVLLLDPTSRIALSPKDRDIIVRHGVMAVDCSWKDVDSVFPKIKKSKKVHPRALPYLIAANPTNYGHPATLSTLEAIASTYYITGFREYARKLLSLYKWGPQFMNLNEAMLEMYSTAEDSKAVIRIQFDIIAEISRDK